MVVTSGGRVADRDGARAFDAVVFDLDGVIVDTERIVHEVWAGTFARYGCSFTLEEWSVAVGSDRGFDPFEVLAARSSVPLPPLAELQREIDREEQRLLEGLSPLPGIRAWIEGANDLGMDVAVVSSSPRPWVEGRLADVGLDRHFVVVSCRDARLAAKPAPDLYLDACARLHVEARRAVAVEDSLHGITAARAAGLACVGVPNTVTAGLDLFGADLLVESLDALPVAEALRRLSERRGR
ncbi:MAG TPA: HAD family phosphatase [Acidimicrobiales bacterium]|nr:HAD family phosphatase [Acidimicrobiales bacterium]